MHSCHGRHASTSAGAPRPIRALDVVSIEHDTVHGTIGEARTSAWRTYLAIDWQATGMDPSTYWQDVCELRLWEPYGLDFRAEQAWFRSAGEEDVPVVGSILLTLEGDHRGAVLDGPADEALEALADLYPATRSRDRYTLAARLLGSRSWRPIEAMAQSQLSVDDRSGAAAVFRAADQPGRHQEHLRKMCRSLTGVDLADNESQGGDDLA